MSTSILSHEYTFPVLLLVSLYTILPVVNSKSMFWRIVFFWSLLLLQIVYLYWRFTVTIVEFELSIPAMWQYLFLFTETLTVIYVCWQCITLPLGADRVIRENIESRCKTEIQNSVDLFIPTYSEPESLLRETIRAAKSDNYPYLTIWVCDDSNRNWLMALCKKEGVNYINRPTDQPLRTKAANLDYSIPYGTAEYIICLDADFQALPDMTETLIRRFRDPDIGLVQAPQHFRNPDAIQNNLQGTGAWAEEQRFFFDISLPSRDAWNNTLCVGSCWAARRKVLDELKGFPTDSIVEDVYFGYRVKSIGWNTTYVNHTVAIGLAAIDAPSYIGQRKRWCLGAIALLSAPHGPFRAKGLSLVDRLFYFEISFYWLTHIHLLLLLIAPILFGFFGVVVFQCSTEHLFLLVIPKNLYSAAIFYWVSEGRCVPLITQVQKTLPIFSVIGSIFKGFVSPDSATFNVTPKESSYARRKIHWNIALPFIALGCLTAASVSSTLLQNFNKFDWSDFVVFNTVLSAYSITVLFLCCLACVEKSRNLSWYAGTICVQGNILTAMSAITKRIFC